MSRIKNLTVCTLLVLTGAFAATAAASAATASAASAQNPFPTRWNTTQRGLILVPDEAHAMTTDLAVKRLRSKSPIRFDLVDGVRDNRTDFKNYDITIILGVTGDNKELAQGWTGERPTNEDAWALKTISTDPLVIVATGNRPRAVLYAVWALADKLELGDDISALGMQETPSVDKRYAAISGSAYGGYTKPPVNRHTMYMATLDELPLYGINGVVLWPGSWRVAVGPGPMGPPVLVGKDGTVTVNEATLPAWRNMLGVLKAYDMDVVMTIEPIVHPAFPAGAISKEYLEEGKRPAGYLEALEPFFRSYMEKLIEILPGIDGFILHPGTEGNGGSSGKSVRTFLSNQNLAASAELTEVYLKVADELAQKYNKSLAFWTHQYGIDYSGMDAMSNMLFKYPRFTIIEDDFWPNYLWFYGDRLPLVAYMDQPMRDQLDKHSNKLAFKEVTDNESFGAGTLPGAIAEPYIYSMREALKRNTGMIIFRMNLHDRTPFGTLFSVSGIQFIQANNQLWQNPAPPQQVWDTWIRRMYGNAAAPLISKALSNDREIIMGLSEIGNLTVFPWLRISNPTSPKGWLPVKGKLPRFGRLAPPKIPKVVESEDQEAAQMRTAPISFAEYSRRNRAAYELVQHSLALIEQARPNLARADYLYLHEIYDCARILLDAVLKLSEAAYATNLVKDNFDNVPDPKGYFDRSIKALEEGAASKDVQWITTQRGYIYGNVAGDMQAIAAAYRKFVGS